MFRSSNYLLILGVFCAVCNAWPASAQLLERTRTVDPSGNANFTTIGDALDAIDDDQTVRWTILIYAGTYTESVVLDEKKENIDIVGVDRDAVIISPTTGGASAIKIISGTEAERNNSIRNLTIDTRPATTGTEGHGIEIVQGTAVPKNINIEGVTIRAGGASNNGIKADDAEDVRIFDCDISAEEHAGVVVGNDFEVINSRISSDGVGESAGAALLSQGMAGLGLNNCVLDGNGVGLRLNANPSNVRALACEIRGVARGVGAFDGDVMRFEGCHIIAEGQVGDNVSPIAVWFDYFPPVGDVLFLGCNIEAIEPETDRAVGVQSNTDASGPGNLRFIECEISATCTNTIGGEAWGVGDIGYVTLIGGSIRTSAAAAKETEVWDIIDGPVGTFVATGTEFTKWKGPIRIAGQPRNVTQTRVNVQPADDDAILTATDLTAAEQPEVEPTGQPDRPRVLVVVGNTAGMGQDVYLEGTNEGNDRIVEKIKLNGTTPVKGKLAFATVTNIILPAETVGPSQSVKIGTTNTLGLPYPLSSKADVLEFARKGATANSYTIEAFSLTAVDEIFSTFAIPSITANDSFRWVVRSGR